MNRTERIKMVKAMEYILRNLNDESDLDSWLILGVADGDIVYGDLFGDGTVDFDYYIEDDEFSHLMALFIKIIKRTSINGGLYCDKVLSKSMFVNDEGS